MENKEELKVMDYDDINFNNNVPTENKCENPKEYKFNNINLINSNLIPNSSTNSNFSNENSEISQINPVIKSFLDKVIDIY
jgi:hypothetical protein